MATVSTRKTYVAFAEAILPGGSSIPAADEHTVGRVERILGEAAGPVVAAWKGAQLALDAAAVARRGRPFRALGRREQDELLLEWERSPRMRGVLNVVAFVYKFIHFDEDKSYEAAGRHFKVLQNVENARWERQIVRGDAWSEPGAIECDVVVVGTGAGGAVVGRELAERGLAVVFVEEGEHKKRDAFTGSFVHAQLNLYRNAFAIGNSPMPTFMGKLVGGSTAVNGGTCLRTPPWILEEWCERLGTDAFEPHRMAPLFERVEQLLSVSIPERQYIGPIADVFDRGCDALGWSRAPIPRNAVGCTGQGFCDFGCSTGARRSMDVSYIPAALERGALLLTALRADRPLIENGRAVGMECTTAAGRVLQVRARAVVFAGGAIPTPLFLLKNGLCNGSGQVGRNLTLHPSGGLAAFFGERMDPTQYIPQAYQCDQFLRDGMLILSALPDANIAPLMFPTTGSRLMRELEALPHMGGFGVLARDTTRNGRVWRDVKGLPAITYNLAPSDVSLLHDGMVKAARIAFEGGAKRVYPSLVGVGPIESKDDVERFARMDLKPDQFALTSYHPLGTCSMGTDPAGHVVGLDHQAHELPGFYIVDGSTVPGPLGVNSQITIMAMATRAARILADRLT